MMPTDRSALIELQAIAKALHDEAHMWPYYGSRHVYQKLAGRLDQVLAVLGEPTPQAKRTDEAWIVIRWRETNGLEAWKFDREDEARAFHDRAQTQWSDCFLARVVKQGAQLDVEPTARRQHVICLCGSTRFIEQFATATWVLELQGHIVLGCTLLPMWFCGVRSHFAEKTGTKDQRDWHHLRKIDLADEVLVLDIGGYIGDSTRNEIAYATEHGKPIRYVSHEPELLAQILPGEPTARHEQDQDEQELARTASTRPVREPDSTAGKG